MKATITSTDQIVGVEAVEEFPAVERELSEHKRPDPATQRAIDMRFIL